MLGRDRDRIAQPEPIGLKLACRGSSTFTLVRAEDDGLSALAQFAREDLIARGDAGARVDHEKAEVGFLDRRLGLRRHACGETLGRGFVKSGGVDQLEIEAGEIAVRDRAVPRNAWSVV